jgi:nucleoporin POM34
LLFSYLALNVTPQVALLRVLQYVFFCIASLLTLTQINDRAAMFNFKNYIPYSNWVVGAIRLLFFINIFWAIRPLFLRPDDVADIPLTPSQRTAMGLDPDVKTPQTPGSVASPNYITPPRYQKSTPRSSFGTPSERGSPLSGSGRASLGMSTSHSPFSPNNGSPLFQKVIGGSATKQLTGSPLGGSSLFLESGSSNTPGTPTPVNGKASVGLNSKWLYEKRRDSRGSALFN